MLLGLPVAGCMVGPDYRRPPPATPLPAVYKELPGWQVARPQDALPKGAWWRIYDDPVLDRLERQVDVGNQTLKEALAAYQIARATVDLNRSSLFPTLSAGLSATRTGRNSSVSTSSTTTGTSSTASAGSIASAATGLATTSATSAVTSTGTSTGVVDTTSSTGHHTIYEIQGGADWEIDVWGRIRRTVESSVASAQASAADIANARLSAQATLATDYFLLRASDAQLALLNRTAQDYQRSLQITQNQYQAGVAARADVLTATVQLESTQASIINLGVLRAQYEHAIAVLTGQPPADLTVSAASLAHSIPTIPAVLPATLLQRRPDIAAAERLMASQNALIGAAIAAYYPTITLSAALDYLGTPLGSLIQAANRVWSLGASASEVLFDGGARTAQVRVARATYDEAVATYRQTVLVALEQVEDELAALRILGQQLAVSEQAVKDSRRSVEITLNEYRAGTQAYTAVVTAQAIALANEETLITLQQERLSASVLLVQALGGGWDAAELPSKDSLQDNLPFLP